MLLLDLELGGLVVLLLDVPEIPQQVFHQPVLRDWLAHEARDRREARV